MESSPNGTTPLFCKSPTALCDEGRFCGQGVDRCISNQSGFRDLILFIIRGENMQFYGHKNVSRNLIMFHMFNVKQMERFPMRQNRFILACACIKWHKK